MTAGGGGGRPQGNGQLSAGDVEQFSREARDRLNDAEALRRDLQRQGVDVRQLDQAIDGMRALSNAQSLADPRVAAELRGQVIEGLKNFEFGLRRSLSDDNRLLLERSGDVHPEYKQSVEEYYRAIGKAKPKTP
jgi:hypothetical protein